MLIKTLYMGLVAGFLNVLITPSIVFLARRKGWYDEVNERKIHTGQIPRLGGVGIFWSFVLPLVGFELLGIEPGLVAPYLPVLGAFLLVHALGLADDFVNLRVRVRFPIQLLIACFIAGNGFVFETIYLPFLSAPLELGWAAYPLTVVWIVGVTNAINMIDGMDGLSGGVSIIAAFSLALLFLQRGTVFPAMANLVIVGSLAGFLLFNFPPAKIFMGDSGSTFLGFFLAVSPLLDRGGAGSGLWFWDGITLLLVPILDVFAAIWRRTREGRSPLSPDKWHLHHKLMRLGLSTRSILAIVYGICMGLGAVVVTGLYLKPLSHWLLVIGAWAVVIFLFALLHILKERRIPSDGAGGAESQS